MDLVLSLIELTDGEVIPIDGKTLRGAKTNKKKSPIIWLVLGQVKTIWS